MSSIEIIRASIGERVAYDPNIIAMSAVVLSGNWGRVDPYLSDGPHDGRRRRVMELRREFVDDDALLALLAIARPRSSVAAAEFVVLAGWAFLTVVRRSS